MAKTNFQIFNEENAPERTYNDSEYKEATQRVGGVMPGMALSRMHNKMYYQWSAMCKAIANLIVNHGHDCMDSDVHGITRYLQEAIVGAATTEITAHRTASELDHPEKSVHKKHLHQDAYESPALTGTPTVPTAGRGTNNGQIASTAFVAQAIAALVNSAPGALDTLQELAAALGNDANFAATVTNALAGKLGKTEKAASAGNSDTLGGQPLQWIIDQINAAKTGIVASNIAPNGWVKFANGLIVQWGMGSEQLSEATQTVIFPITFSRGCFSLITGTILSVAGIRNDSMWQVATVERERAVLFHQHFTADGVGKTKPTYIAIGV